MKNKTCCFTGHREIPIDQLSIVKQRTEEYIRRLIDKGVIYFGVGGALGYDTLVARLLLTLRETEFNHIKVILVYPFHGFTNCWTPAQQATYNELLLKYDKRVCISKQAGKGAYLQRNRHLVDFSGYCIAYCTRPTGGTAYTLRYAQVKGLNIWNTATIEPT